MIQDSHWACKQDKLAPMSTGLNLKVLSYNIHKGFSPGNRRFVLNQTYNAIREVQADLVFLQEVSGQNHHHAQSIKEWPAETQFEFLADKAWEHYVYGKNAVYDAGHHGNAILSKFPITSWENHNISVTQLEQRGLLYAAVSILPLNITLHCFCLHLNLFGGHRERQLAEMITFIKGKVREQEPLIIAGDFNDWRKKASRLIEGDLGAQEAFKTATGRYARTYPARKPMLCLDRIYTRGFSVIQPYVLRGKLWDRLSDHAAVAAELELSLK